MSLISTRYSEAFFSLAIKQNKVEEYKNELLLIKKTLNNVDNVKDFFMSERISKDEKKKLIEDTFSNSISKDSLNFLFVLVDNRRISNYKEIIDAYYHLANKELKISEGILEVPHKVDDSLINKLSKALSKDDRTVELTQKINKDLISGFKITLENEVINASLKNKIDNLYMLLQRKES